MYWMGDNAKALIERVQPYKRANPYLDALWLIREFDNIDKHRVIPVAATTFETAEHVGKGLPIAPKSSAEIFIELGPIVDDMELVKIALEVPQPNFDPHLKVTFNVMFRDPPVPDKPRIMVAQALKAFSEQVSDIIKLFSPAFDTGQYDDRALA